MTPIPELAAAAVALLAPYLSQAATEGAKTLGKAAAEKLSTRDGKVKAGLASPAAREALGDLEKAPDDEDTRAALRKELKKRLAEDPAFQAELAALVEEIARTPGVSIAQMSRIEGDGNVNVQIAGGGNQVGTFDRRG
jgi:hypothetical protein